MATVVRWNPVREIAAMQDVMDRFFDDNRRVMHNGVNTRALALDVHENDNVYTVVTALPGIDADSINIRLHEDTLTINAEISKPEVADDTRILLNERTYGNFSRSINLPKSVDADNVEAAFDNGLLTLTLPKIAEAQPRQIPVRVNGQLANEN